MARHERACGPLKAGGRRVEWYRYGVTSRLERSFRRHCWLELRSMDTVIRSPELTCAATNYGSHDTEGCVTPRCQSAGLLYSAPREHDV